MQRNSRNGGLVYDSGDTPERDEKLRDTFADLVSALAYDVEAEARHLLRQPGALAGVRNASTISQPVVP